MGPKQPAADSRDFFRQPLVDMINPKHPLVSLAAVIDWDEIEQSFGAHFASSVGRPALSPRLVAGLPEFDTKTCFSGFRCIQPQ